MFFFKYPLRKILPIGQMQILFLLYGMHKLEAEPVLFQDTHAPILWILYKQQLVEICSKKRNYCLFGIYTVFYENKFYKNIEAQNHQRTMEI